MARKGLVLSGVLIGLLVLASWGASAHFAQDEAFREVRLAPLERKVPASGELRSGRSVNVGCPQIPRTWNFTITSIAAEGREVTAGTPLLSFDAQALQERLRVKSSELDTARKELEKTRLVQEDLEQKLVLRRAELAAQVARIDRKLDVPEDLRGRIELAKLRLDEELAESELALVDKRLTIQRESGVARVRDAEERVATLEREVGALREHIAKMTVVAPRDGYVVHGRDWRGNKAKQGDSVWMGRTLITIADLGAMEVMAKIAEPDAGHVAVGQRVEIRLDAAPERLFHGKIERLGRLFRQKSWEIPSKILDAVVSIEEPDAELMRPGMAASLEIVAELGEPVLQVAESALIRKGDDYFVRVKAGLGSEHRAVEIGERWDGNVVIAGGLSAGERIVVPR